MHCVYILRCIINIYVWVVNIFILHGYFETFVGGFTATAPCIIRAYTSFLTFRQLRVQTEFNVGTFTNLCGDTPDKSVTRTLLHGAVKTSKYR